ncbi:serine/threonine-protein phosphatase 2a regulatory subunit b [Plakobranchus ocellatus]|uniref:Serine/threonine-protein phosphatase 2a regulatory subunit b n=1 Tax=Plakobranchus ocellatus TaxID=259542 RepID=A0AAV4DWX3_9GAST|nr:serine/threonine-protein phosphatase 2a regulatory subunit b [Plakobranchus ocellatus]
MEKPVGLALRSVQEVLCGHSEQEPLWSSKFRDCVRAVKSIFCIEPVKPKVFFKDPRKSFKTPGELPSHQLLEGQASGASWRRRVPLVSMPPQEESVGFPQHRRHHPHHGSLLNMAVRKARKMVTLDCFGCVLCGGRTARAIKPVVPGSLKEKDTGNHIIGQTTPAGPQPVTGKKGGVKDNVGSNANGDGLSLKPANETHLANRKGCDASAQQQQQQQRVEGGKDATQKQGTTPATISNNKQSANNTREGNKENRGRKRTVGAANRIGSASAGSSIPQFYFPMGKPESSVSSELDSVLQRLSKEFGSLEGGKAYKQQMAAITKLCGLPSYWKVLLFRAAGGSTDGFITYSGLAVLLKKLYQTCHDEASKFLRLAAKPGSNLLDFEDFEPFVQDIVETHPGLTFLQDAPEFHSRYVTTVISRVMFCVNRSWTGQITLPELRKGNFLQTVRRLEEEDDINQIKDYFSYEHFYVIYCKFWELDKDHDLYIDKADLSRHNDHALNSRLIDRIFSGAVTRGPDFEEGRMSYREFVWFLLAEEDKRHMTSIEYWFRCMDLDGDGVISMYEMEFFHEEQMNKMETLGIERLPFEDTVCQMLDMVSPRIEGKITLGDLKACKMTNIFFDTFFNLDKFLEHEQRDPFANARDPNAEHVEVSDWNKYAEEEYDILVADEGNADLEDGNYEDDFETEDEDELVREEMLRLADSGGTPATSSGRAGPGLKPGESHTAEDIYDFSSTSNLGY